MSSEVNATAPAKENNGGNDTQKTEAPSETGLQLGSAGKGATIGVGERGLQLSNLDDAWKFCTAMAASGMMPKGMETAQKVLYAIELGFEVGLPPLAAVQSIAVINGRASLYGDVMLGLVQASGKFDFEAFEETVTTDAEGVPDKATCTVRRLPNGKPVTGEFTMAEAKKAGLATKEGPWRNYPRRMLQMRARSYALRDAFPDVLKGIISREEAMDIPPERNVTPPPASTRPETIDDLTSQLEASQEEITRRQEPETAKEQTPAEELTAAAASTISTAAAAGEADALAAIKGSIADAKYVTDLKKLREVWCGQNSKLTGGQRFEIGNLIGVREAEIKNKKKSNGDQGSLV
jgi:hypothetical protein